MYTCVVSLSERNIIITFRSPDSVTAAPRIVVAHEDSNLNRCDVTLAKDHFVESLAPQSQMALSLFSWLHTAAPAFPVEADNIRVLKDPSEFYQTLLEKSSTARHRIIFSSLYLGTGHLEKALVSSKPASVYVSI